MQRGCKWLLRASCFSFGNARPAEQLGHKFVSRAPSLLSQSLTPTTQDVVISSDGQFALSGSWDGTLRLWDLNTGNTTRRFVGHSKDVLSVAFSVDNRQARIHAVAVAPACKTHPEHSNRGNAAA